MMLEVNPDWYVARYPLAREEIEAGRFASAQQHYELAGRSRGYRPYSGGERFTGSPDAYYDAPWANSADAHSRLDMMRLDSAIVARHESALRCFIDNGYAILPGLLDPATIDAARQELDDVYQGRRADIKFSWEQGETWAPEILHRPAKALDVHFRCEGIRNAVLAQPIVEVLRCLFEGEVMVSQTLGFYRGSGQELHQDTAYVTYSKPRFFVGVWTALEDVLPGAGELVYVPGSQRIRPHLFADRYFSVHEALNAKAIEDRQAATRAYLDGLRNGCNEAGLSLEHFYPRAGDVLIWDALLAHGGARISTEQTRRSVVTHFCPAEVAPHYFEHSRRPFLQHANGARYSNFAY